MSMRAGGKNCMVDAAQPGSEEGAGDEGTGVPAPQGKGGLTGD